MNRRVLLRAMTVIFILTEENFQKEKIIQYLNLIMLILFFFIRNIFYLISNFLNRKFFNSYSDFGTHIHMIFGYVLIEYKDDDSEL